MCLMLSKIQIFNFLRNFMSFQQQNILAKKNLKLPGMLFSAKILFINQVNSFRFRYLKFARELSILYRDRCYISLISFHPDNWYQPYIYSSQSDVTSKGFHRNSFGVNGKIKREKKINEVFVYGAEASNREGRWGLGLIIVSCWCCGRLRITEMKTKRGRKNNKQEINYSWPSAFEVRVDPESRLRR